MSDPRRDLPLFPDTAPTEPPRTPRSTGLTTARPPEPREPPVQATLPAPDAPAPETFEIGELEIEALEIGQASPRRSPPRAAAPLAARWRAGGFDLLLHAALGLVLLAGSWLLGAAAPGVPEGLGVAVFLVVFSFLYSAIPLAFWGQTPGMMRAGLVAAGGEDTALTFGQTALRWLGAILTLALLGLPSLLVLAGGRSLTDRLSGSRTWRQDGRSGSPRP